MAKWNDQQRRRIIELYHQGKSQPEIAQELGSTRSTIWRTLDHMRASGELDKNQVEPVVMKEFRAAAESSLVRQLETKLAMEGTGMKDFTTEPEYNVKYDAKRHWAAAESDSVERIHKVLTQGNVSITLPNEVFAVSYISDQHLGPGTPCDMKRMREDAELIAETPGLYAISMGDGVDNHIKHRSAMLSSRSQPGEQYDLYEHYLNIFSPKILALISGNHDDWTKQFAGIDVVARIAKSNRIFFAPDEARIKIKVGSQNYRFAARHQYRLNSSFNQSHSVKQWLRLGMEDFDVGGIGHHHEATIESHIYRGQKVWVLRPGSYQISSQYSRQLGYNNSIPTCPTLVCWPDSRKIVGFDDVRDASDYLTWARAKYNSR